MRVTAARRDIERWLSENADPTTGTITVPPALVREALATIYTSHYESEGKCHCGHKWPCERIEDRERALYEAMR